VLRCRAQALGAEAALRYPFDVWMTSSEAPPTARWAPAVAAAPKPVAAASGATVPLLLTAEAALCAPPPPPPPPLAPRLAGRACRVPGCTSSAEEFRTYNARCRREHSGARTGALDGGKGLTRMLTRAARRALPSSSSPAQGLHALHARAGRAGGGRHAQALLPEVRVARCLLHTHTHSHARTL
jgi:hypothetical protein